MRKLIMTCAVLALFSCKKEEKTEKKGKLADAITSVKNVNNISNSLVDIQKNLNELKTKTPVTNDELKAVLPENLMGMKRTELTLGSHSMANVSGAEATYKEEGKSISVKIMDGAGPAGSGMISIFMMGLSANLEKTNEAGFEKITEVNGSKMSIKEYKRGNSLESEIQYISNNRFLIMAEGENVSYEELSNALKEINFSGLT